MVRRFAAEGAAVAFTGRDGGARMRRSRARPERRFIEADVRSDGDTGPERWPRRSSELGGLDVLVCNAGTGLVSPLAETSPDELNLVLDVNVTGCLRYARACLPHLEAAARSDDPHRL